MVDGDRLAGAWRLVSWVSVAAAHSSPVFGPSPRGTLVLDPRSRIAAVQIAAAPRAQLSVALWLMADPGEARAAYASYFAYWGRYTVDEAAATLTIVVEDCLFPNWSGSEQRRAYRFDGGDLVLSSPAMMVGGEAVHQQLRWSRAPGA
jgi:Lipocalin-like domain